MKIAVLGAQGTGTSSLIESLKKVLPEDYVLTDLPAQLNDVDLTVLMGLDMAWTPDQAQQSSAQTRESMDACLRAALTEQGCDFVVVYGNGAACTASALQAIAHHAGQPDPRPPEKKVPWQWDCEKCSDGSCEYRMFTGLLKIPSSSRPASTN